MSAPLRLNPTQYADLLDEVAAMVAARRALVPGLRTLEDRQLGRIGRAASSLRGQLQQGCDLAGALQTLDAQTGPQLAAAFRMAVETGDAKPLHRLAELLRRRRDLTVATRLAMLYPLMLLVLAYAILVLVFAPLVTQEQTALSLWPPHVVAAGRWLTEYFFLPPLAAALIAGLLWLGMRRNLHSSMQALLPGRYGRLSLFCQTMALQIEAGVPQGEAVRSAAAISGDRQLQRAVAELASQLERGETGTPASGAASRGQTSSAPVPPMLAWLLRQAPMLGADSTQSQLDSLGRWYDQRERDQRRWWIRWLPGLLVSLIGGTFVLGYLLLALRPVYNQLAGIG